MRQLTFRTILFFSMACFIALTSCSTDNNDEAKGVIPEHQLKAMDQAKKTEELLKKKAEEMDKKLEEESQ